jgi:hypothetical protein
MTSTRALSRRRRSAAALAWLLLLGLGAAGCSDGATDPAGMDQISVVSITPAASTPLRRGQRVVLTAQLEYELNSSASGRVAMMPQSGTQVLRGARQPTADVARGRNVVVLTDTVTVAVDQGTLTDVEVFFPLFPMRNGVPSATRVVASVRFPVQ